MSPKVETKDELPASQDTPAADGPATKEVESTSLPGPTTNGTTAVNKDDGSHYFPEVPEPLDEAPER